MPRFGILADLCLCSGTRAHVSEYRGLWHPCFVLHFTLHVLHFSFSPSFIRIPPRPNSNPHPKGPAMPGRVALPIECHASRLREHVFGSRLRMDFILSETCPRKRGTWNPEATRPAANGARCGP